MNRVYFSHSYRKEDAGIVQYFGFLLRHQGLILSLDPPSETLNAAKLERHINSSDGMIAVVTKREEGVSQHILFEIMVGLRAGKPVLVFVEDEFSDSLIPSRILQRRFSRSSYWRQLRQHQDALQILKAQVSDQPPLRHQPSTSRKSCLFIGIERFPQLQEVLTQVVEERGYNAVDPVKIRQTPREISETIASADVALCCVDSQTPESQFLFGAARARSIPTIAFTGDTNYYSSSIPMEYQPRLIQVEDQAVVQSVVGTEFDVFEEDFVKLNNEAEVEAYTSLLVGRRAFSRY